MEDSNIMRYLLLNILNYRELAQDMGLNAKTVSERL